MCDADPVDRNIAGVDQYFHAGVSGVVQSTRKRRVQFVAGCERAAVRALNHKQNNGTVPLSDHRFKFSEVLQRSRGDTIGKLGQSRRPHQVAVFDF